MLGVSPVADEAVVRAAWRALCRKYHPDTADGAPDAAEKFRAINAAYAVLNDPNRRIAYDLERRALPEHEPAIEPERPIWIESPYPMPPRRTGGMTAGLILAFVALPAIAIMLPGVPGQVAAMLPGEGGGIGTFSRASLNQVRRLLSPAGFGGAEAAPRPAAGPMPDVDPRTVASARVQYGRVVGRHGAAGVPVYGQACAERAKAFATWQAMDFCAAFEIRAGRLDERSVATRYARLGANPAAAAARIGRIRALVD